MPAAIRVHHQPSDVSCPRTPGAPARLGATLSDRHARPTVAWTGSRSRAVVATGVAVSRKARLPGSCTARALATFRHESSCRTHRLFATSLALTGCAGNAAPPSPPNSHEPHGAGRIHGTRHPRLRSGANLYLPGQHQFGGAGKRPGEDCRDGPLEALGHLRTRQHVPPARNGEANQPLRVASTSRPSIWPPESWMAPQSIRKNTPCASPAGSLIAGPETAIRAPCKPAGHSM